MCLRSAPALLALRTSSPRSPPVVTSEKYDRLALKCTAPPLGGPWATCAIELCEVAGPSRRRELLTASCTPIKVNCTFNATAPQPDVCTVDLTGLVIPDQEYTVIGTATKADGRRSLTGPQNSYKLLPYP